MSMMAFAAGNDAVVDQEGDNQTAVVNQTGDDNNTDVTQENADPKVNQDADVDQDGDENQVEIYQHYLGSGPGWTIVNSATAFQLGNYNKIFQDVNANNGNVTANQYGDNNVIHQNIDSGYTESLYAEQIGFDNFAQQIMNGGGTNDAYIYQEGDENVATQDINGFNHGYWGNDSLFYQGDIDISQVGDENNATQALTGFANSSLIWQYGYGNNATGEAAGNHNEIYVLQGLDGLPNFAIPGFPNNFPPFAGKGNNNTAYVYQEGNNNIAGIGQFGDNNNSKVKQYNDDNVFITIQNGNDNYVNGVDEASGDLTFNANKSAKQYNGAVFLSYQEGISNEIGLRQGQDDFGVVWQDGENNQALLYQFGGSDHSAIITQNGNSNTAEVFQQ